MLKRGIVCRLTAKFSNSTTHDKAHIPNNLTLCHRETLAGRVLASSCQRREGCIQSRTVNGAGCWEH